MKRNMTNHNIDSATAGGGFWHRVRERWLGGLNLPGLGFGHGNDIDTDRQVKVWDRHRGCYRYVNLNDRSDPLWSSACAVATQQRENDARRSAA